MTPDEIQIRRDICKDCGLPCDVRELINHADPCQGCPLRVWHGHSDCGKLDQSEKPVRTSGDITTPPSLFAQIFKPCSPCSKKR